MRFISFFTCLTIAACSFGQQSPAGTPLVLFNITEQNGLSDDHVHCVIKDKTGLVWIGTADGLDLMDGSSITIFKHRDGDSASLIDNNILSLAEDGQGNIWIGTIGGLSCYDKKQQVFISAAPPLSPYGSAIFIQSIVFDKQQRVWCATDGGLMQVDLASKKFIPFYNLSGEQGSNITMSNKLYYMIADSRNYLWLCSADGLWSFDLKTLQFKKEIHKNNDKPYEPLFLSVCEDHDHNIWAGDWSGLKLLNRNSGRVTDYSSLPNHPRNIKSIRELRQPDGKYVLWLNGKLFAFDPAGPIFFQYPKPPQMADYPDVMPSFISTDGWLWMASENQGLFIYNPKRQIFQHHFFNRSITSQGIVFTTLNHQLLAGAQAKDFLKIYDTNWNIKKDFSGIMRSDVDPAATCVLAFALENENSIWVGTSQGIVHMNPLTGANQWYIHQENDSTSIPRNFIAHLFFDSRKELWVFPWREGIWKMDTKTGACKRLLEGVTRENDHTKRLLIADAAEDNDGNIWMADLDEGILFYNRRTGEFSKPFAKELGVRNHMTRIFFKNGFCYSYTSNAVFKWDPRSLQFEFIYLPPEINKECNDMFPDRDGNWWISSKNGLIVFDEMHNSFKRFTTTDGLADNDMNGTLFCREDGTMLFGTADYFTSFDPAKLSALSDSATRLMRTGIFVNEKPANLNDAGILDLDHRSTNIVFKWALPDYTDPLKNRYYCRLEGIDSGWKYLGNKGEVQYANLSAGHYTVLLKGATSNGTASADMISIPFIIHPPFWKTDWFILLVSLAVLTVFVAVVRYISQRNLKEKLLKLEKEQAIEKERNRISRDMHDDLGSGLTKIAILSEVVKRQIQDPEKARQQLDTISESSRELVDNLQDIIWVLNPRNDTLESLAAYIREYALKFFEPFGTTVRFQYPEKFRDVKLSEETRRNIFLTIKESLHNISKHAWCNTVTLSIEQAASRIIVQIRDDGKGFASDAVRPFGNGLINMQQRIEQIGGTYSIQSAIGKGTVTAIQIKG